MLCKGVTLLNQPENYKLGSVGSPPPSVKVRLANPDTKGDGELAFWGRNVMMGYLNRLFYFIRKFILS